MRIQEGENAHYTEECGWISVEGIHISFISTGKSDIIENIHTERIIGSLC